MHDFHKQYLNLPNKDLIRIASNPANYQPAAVDAATAILSTRTISDEDYALACLEDEEQEKWLRMRPGFIDSWMNKIHDAISYLIVPSDKFDPRRWVIIVCIVLGCEYIYYDFGQFKFLWFLFFKCNDCPIGFDGLYIILLLLVTPITIILLLKRSIFGWGLLIANTVFNILVTLKIIFTQTGIFESMTDLILRVGLNAAILFFLFKKEVKVYFMKTSSKERFDDFLEEPSPERIAE